MDVMGIGNGVGIEGNRMRWNGRGGAVDALERQTPAHVARRM
jgi:hypothetical protein